MAALLLAAGNSWALGLGQIQVKSKRNQPLLAEIPIISTTQGELAALKARLASPETFRRVGLTPPTGIAADLQFSLGSDAKGRPVIRVTTVRPVDQGALNFLVEVDWGKGRLVREYSALVDTPNTAAAIVQPVIQAPQAPADNRVQRPAAELPVAAPVEAQPEPTPSAAVASAVPEANAAEPVPPSVEIAPLPTPPARPEAASVDTNAEYGPVKRGETLSAIASGLGLRQSFSLDQTMLALLRANPDAFLGDDVNRLRSGAVLRLPEQGEVARIDAAEAALVVRQQMQQWRQTRRALRQPEGAAAAVDGRKPSAAPASAAGQVATAAPVKPTPKPAARKPAGGPQTGGAAAASKAQAPSTASAASARRQEARLQIVPPSVSGKATGTKSGTQAGGEGSMLQQELRQRDEDIAAKSAEIGELKERVAELEKLKAEQQTLLTLKDSELAAAQQRLAEANKLAAQPAATKTAQAVPASPEPETAQGGVAPYAWGGLGVVALALLAWLVAGKRKKAPPPRRSVFDSEALAASMAAPASRQPMDAPAEPLVSASESEAPAVVEDVPTIDLNSVPAVPPRRETPAWHSAWVKTESAPPSPAPAVPVPAPAPTEVEDALPEPELPVTKASIEQQFKLVDAFIDMGDKHSARELLAEMMSGDDDEAAAKAGKMLTRLMG